MWVQNLNEFASCHLSANLDAICANIYYRFFSIKKQKLLKYLWRFFFSVASKLRISCSFFLFLLLCLGCLRPIQILMTKVLLLFVLKPLLWKYDRNSSIFKMTLKLAVCLHRDVNKEKLMRNSISWRDIKCNSSSISGECGRYSWREIAKFVAR